MSSPSFHEIRFPPNICYDATGAPGFKTAVLSHGVRIRATATFQLFEPYNDVAPACIRPIRDPVAGTLSLFNDESVTTDWSLDRTTGEVTLGTTSQSTTGHVLSGGFQFDAPVRLDTDDMQTSIDGFDIVT